MQKLVKHVEDALPFRLASERRHVDKDRNVAEVFAEEHFFSVCLSDRHVVAARARQMAHIDGVAPNLSTVFTHLDYSAIPARAACLVTQRVALMLLMVQAEGETYKADRS